MSPVIETIGETAVVDLSEFEFEPEQTCDYGDCENEATFLIECPVCGMTELTCTMHRMELAQVPDMVLVFNDTCGHGGFRVKDCRFIPLGA